MLKLILLFRRKPGMSRADFIDYYERVHAPLSVEKIPGIALYRRSYVEPGEPPFGHPTTEPGFDVVTELGFDSQADYDRAVEAFTSPELGSLFYADMQNLFDLSEPQRAYFIRQEESAIPAVHSPA
jgi:uncharacterized protein (TIGR02118 family)